MNSRQELGSFSVAPPAEQSWRAERERSSAQRDAHIVCRLAAAGELEQLADDEREVVYLFIYISI